MKTSNSRTLSSSAHRMLPPSMAHVHAACTDVIVGTKVRLPSGDFVDIADTVAKSLEGSLARLRLDRVDIFHLHNVIETGGGEALSVRQVLDDVAPAFERRASRARRGFLGSLQSVTRRCIE